jgi:hypothetical protein
MNLKAICYSGFNAFLYRECACTHMGYQATRREFELSAMLIIMRALALRQTTSTVQ